MELVFQGRLNKGSMHPVIRGSRMAACCPAKKCAYLGLGCRNSRSPLLFLLVNLNLLLVWFGSGSSSRQLLRVDTFVRLPPYRG